mmetsp:Transcript_21008/g.34727  ORF Transcript_21008/g.34727 Transcript_21008/m.34727 type:complete len:365 (+) Transcript_21008:281-1375(+)|eukprot:CAMPEP_0119026328 /NCGR_PEP_ID=MMETSP1176-20130426/35263_1 /TAXON_ID=265551 /ORGANISM="Synedropsis recta cf, Strain CCMP1620" /LENGTH=364 /DNA_ID=CAMNT_0006982017 /DNA_START=133 /DNA_END=1227 /DNA_ORIENTATION=+
MARSSFASLIAVVVSVLVTVCLSLLMGSVGICRQDSSAIPANRAIRSTPPRRNVKLVIAIGSKPTNGELRQWLRSSWMQWAASSSEQVEIRFFTERTNETEQEDAGADDIVFLDPKLGGYWGSARRIFEQFDWFLSQDYHFEFFLRVDDDGFLCLPTLLKDLEQAPSTHFFWGKYFCQENRITADENFMLFSNDLIQFFQAAAPVLRINEKATFAAHFALWQHMLQLQVLDDRDRIDAQQGYLTQYMRGNNDKHKNVEDFCATHIWAHHVKTKRVFEEAYRMATEGSLLLLPSVKSTANKNDTTWHMQDSLGNICLGEPNLSHQGECSGGSSLYQQKGIVPGFQKSQGFPSIQGNAQYSCATPS